MKSIPYLVIALVLTFFSCQKNDEVLFALPLPLLNLTIPAGINPVEAQYFNIDSVPTNLFNVANARNIDLGSVQQVIPATATLRSIFGTDYSFAFEVTIQLCEVGDKSPNCGREIFWRQPVPENIGSFLEFVPNENNVKDALEEELVNIQVKIAQLRSTSPAFIESELLIEFVAL